MELVRYKVTLLVDVDRDEYDPPSDWNWAALIDCDEDEVAVEDCEEVPIAT